MVLIGVREGTVRCSPLLCEVDFMEPNSSEAIGA